MQIGICDDIEIFRTHMAELCAGYFNNKNINFEIIQFSLGKELLNFKEKIDILILDIELPEIDGIEVKDYLDKRKEEIAIIYVTNHIERMKEAFGRNVYGFIEKKENKERLFILLDKICDNIIDYCHIEVETNLIKKLIKSNDIIRLEVKNQYVDIHTKIGIYLKRVSLSELETKLSAYDFCRIDRKHIVNLKFVDSINDGVKLTNGYQYNLTNKMYSRFKSAYINYIKKKAV